MNNEKNEKKKNYIHKNKKNSFNSQKWNPIKYVLKQYLPLSNIKYSKIKSGVSSWCNGYSDGLSDRSKRVQTPVALLRSLSDKYP